MHGKRYGLSNGRKLIGELCHFAMSTPNGVMERAMQLDPVIEARAGVSGAPAWPVLIAKAVALVATEIPALRQSYVRLPRRGFYENDFSNAVIVVEREVAGETIPLFAILKRPEDRDLAELNTELRNKCTAPLETVREFRISLRVARLPAMLRRLVWWLGLNHGPSRMTHFGSFGISITAQMGAEIVYGVSPLSYFVTFGKLASGEKTAVRMSFDHRVTDGSTIARALVRLEQVLNTIIADELKAMAEAAVEILPDPFSVRLLPDPLSARKTPQT